MTLSRSPDQLVELGLEPMKSDTIVHVPNHDLWAVGALVYSNG